MKEIRVRKENIQWLHLPLVIPVLSGRRINGHQRQKKASEADKKIKNQLDAEVED